MIMRPGKWLLMLLALSWLQLSPLQGEDDSTQSPARQKLARDYDKSIHPLMARLCLGCHSTKEKKGELDLERFTSLDQVSTDLKPWQGMIEQLETREMPPEGKPQPTAVERSMLITWVREMLGAEARARAGDPGPIVLRRLRTRWTRCISRAPRMTAIASSGWIGLVRTPKIPGPTKSSAFLNKIPAVANAPKS